MTPLISLDRGVERRSSVDTAYVTPIILFSWFALVVCRMS
jgi:hypothetical protein